MHCVNRNIPEFKLLTDQSGLSEEALAAKVSVWQDRHNTDAIPSMVELYNSPNQGIKYQLPKQQSDSIDNVFDENLELAEAIYEGLGFKGRKIKSFDIFSEIEKNTKREDLKKITPQQKQQAKEVYQQYLDSELGSKQDIQQVKEFISSRNNQGNNQSLQEGLNWLESVNPNVQPEIVQGLIDGIANGSYNSNLDLITLSEEFANKKTVKHEFLHSVASRLFATQEHYVLDKMIKKGEIEENCTGKLKAKEGLQFNFKHGGKWKVIKDLKGYPTHKEGGVDLTIGKNGVSIKNGNTQFTAKHGLVIPKAQNGLTIPSWMNPKNWGVTDYSDKGDFNTAYSNARKSGEKEFLFNGKRYNTNYKGTPQQQLKETGLTNEQITGNKTLKKIYKNTTPYTSILPPLIQGLKGFAGFEDKNRDINVENPIPIAYYLENNQKVFRDLPEEEQKKYKELSKPYFKRADDAWALYTGNPQRFKTFEISNHKPSNSKNKDDYYYSLHKSYPELLEFIEKEGMDLKPGESKQVEEPTKLMLRNFKIGKGKDERGDYISYYDNWNLNPSLEFPIPEQGKPFEIYDRIYIKDYGDGKQKRMYYTDKELSELNIDKKDFDTLGLQRELSNRGYKLPKSTKQDGSFDGIWGDEIKNALLEYRKSQNKSKQ